MKMIIVHDHVCDALRQLNVEHQVIDLGSAVPATVAAVNHPKQPKPVKHDYRRTYTHQYSQNAELALGPKPLRLSDQTKIAWCVRAAADYMKELGITKIGRPDLNEWLFEAHVKKYNTRTKNVSWMVSGALKEGYLIEVK